jgi:hypothetical protein
MTAKRVEDALVEYETAGRLLPEMTELSFWYAVTLASVGREKQAEPLFRRLFAKEPFWADLLPRLPPAGLFPDDQALLKRVLALAPRTGKKD